MGPFWSAPTWTRKRPGALPIPRRTAGKDAAHPAPEDGGATGIITDGEPFVYGWTKRSD